MLTLRGIRVRRFLLVALLAFALNFAFLQAPHASATLSEKIVGFYGVQMISINPDGTDPTLLGEGVSPQIAPDGQKILSYNITGTCPTTARNDLHIFVQNIDGTNKQDLTPTTCQSNRVPVWSPDGTKIAFTRLGPGSLTFNILIMNADGSDIHVAVPEAREPSWSPDGTKIAFHSTTEHLGIANVDGSNRVEFPQFGNIQFPSWSPDGARIAFYQSAADQSGIRTIKPDGTDFRAIPNTITSEVPVWSPDSTRIAYGGNADYHVNIVSAEGGEPTMVYSPLAVSGWGFIGSPNSSPSAGAISAPTAPVLVNTQINASDDFSDIDIADTHTAIWDWGDGTTSAGSVAEGNGLGTVAGTHTYAVPGVYELTLTITDNHGAYDTEMFQYVSVYRPTSRGLFSGASRFTTPTGSYPENPGLSGQVKFGIVAKYDNSDQPIGNASMNFKAANLDFNAADFSVLVTADGTATLRGTGTINGSGNYTFLATGIDAAADTIRFQIKDGTTVIFDSQPGAVDTANPSASVTGQVVVH